MRSVWEKLRPLLKAAWAHRWIAVGVAWLVCAAGWAGVSLLPTSYESMARVYVNVDPILTPLLRGLAADTNPTRQLEYMRHTLLSRPNLEEAAKLAELPLGSAKDKEELLTRMASTIRIDGVTPNLMSISYRSQNPQRAKNVVQALLTIFSEKTTGNSRKEMDSAEQFLDSEIANYQHKLRTLETQRTDLVRDNPDLLTGDAGGNKFDQTRQAVIQLELQLADATAGRDSVQKQLAAVPPMLSVDQAPQVVIENAKDGTAAQGLDQARKRLVELRLRYTEQFPDVIAARREVAEFEAQAKSAAKSGTGQPGAVKGQIANAVYDQLQLKLADAETAVASLERKLTQAKSDQQRIAAAARKAPGILAKARDLERDYGTIKTTYDSLVQRRQAAQIADSASTKTDQIQFRIVDPPEVPTLPAAPNRPLLYSAVLLIGIGAGLAIPFGLLQLDRSFATISDLRSFGVPVVGSVSLLVLGAFRVRMLRQAVMVGTTFGILLATYGTLLAMTAGFRIFGLS